MNNTNQTKNNMFRVISTFAKDNLKTIIISLLIIFLIFLTYQGYSYYKKNKLDKLSILYFESKDIEDEFVQISQLNSISKENGFYSILSKIELINKHIDKNEFDESIKLYNEILSSKDLDSNYVAMIAIKGAYQLIDITIKYNNDEYINVINKFISLIDDNLENYAGNKNELLYITSILSLNDDSSYKNNSELLSLYENIINNDNISPTIKERINKIHEFYIFI